MIARRSRWSGVGLVLTLTVALGAGVVAPAAVGEESGEPESLAVFDRPATKRDKLPARIRRGIERSGFAKRYGADLDQSRRTVDLVWAIPAGDDVCIVVEMPGLGSGGSCGPLTAVQKGMRITGTYGRHGGRRFTAGLVGNDVTAVKLTFADGRSKTFPVVDNGFYAAPLVAGVGVKVSFERSAP